MRLAVSFLMIAVAFFVCFAVSAQMAVKIMPFPLGIALAGVAVEGLAQRRKRKSVTNQM